MKNTCRLAIEAELKSARDIAADAEKDTTRTTLTDDEMGRIEGHLQKAAELSKSAEREDHLAKQLSDITGSVTPANTIDGPGTDPFAGLPDINHAPRPKHGASGAGDAFVKSPEYKAMLASAPPGGRFSEKTRIQSQPFATKALITGLDDASAGALVTPQRLGMLDPFYERPLTIRSLFTPGTTASDTIEYVRMLSVDNNAAPVAEATSSGVIGEGTPVVTAAAGGLKPESGMVFEPDTTNVKTIAHWIPATKRSLADAAQIKTLIDTFLQYGLEEAFEDQLMTGNGVGENFLGLNATSGIQTQAAPAGAQDVYDVTRMARRKVRIGGRAVPTAYAMNPIDWETVELKRDLEGRFYGAGPFAMTTPSLWGLPVVESEAVPVGTAWCADWRMGIIWDREQASIQITDSHLDFFVRNLVAILCEMPRSRCSARPRSSRSRSRK